MAKSRRYWKVTILLAIFVSLVEVTILLMHRMVGLAPGGSRIIFRALGFSPRERAAVRFILELGRSPRKLAPFMLRRFHLISRVFC